MTPVEHITLLARSFPTLARQADGLAPWDADELDRWTCGPVPGSGALHAARFVLAVWRDAPWECGPFDVVSAMAAWDEHHRAAFLAWAAEPWWP